MIYSLAFLQEEWRLNLSVASFSTQESMESTSCEQSVQYLTSFAAPAPFADDAATLRGGKVLAGTKSTHQARNLTFAISAG